MSWRVSKRLCGVVQDGNEEFVDRCGLETAPEGRGTDPSFRERGDGETALFSRRRDEIGRNRASDRKNLLEVPASRISFALSKRGPLAQLAEQATLNR